MHRKIQHAIPLLFVSLIFALAIPRPAFATLSSLSDQLERLNESTVSGHTIKFVTSTGVTAGQSLVVNFPSGVFTFGGSYDFNDMELAEGSTSNCSSATFTPATLGASPSGATWGATYASDVVTFTSGTGTITAGRCVRITLSTNGAGHTLTNPAVASNTSYVLSVSEPGGDVGSLAVLIVNDLGTPDSDQIELQADLGSSLIFDVDVAATNCDNAIETDNTSNIINFGTLPPTIAKYSTGAIKFACIDVGTTSANGIDVFINSARASAIGGLNRSGGGAIVSATADLNSGLVDSGYGIRVSSVGTPDSGSFTIISPFDSATPGDVGEVPGASGTPANIVSSTAPAQTGASSRIAVEIGAKASVATSAGYYTDTLTFTATPNF